MCDAEDGEGEVFEITDFTSASDWERFIGSVTELLHEWKADKEPLTAPEGKEAPAATPSRPILQQSEVDFAGCRFTVTFVDLPGRAERRSSVPSAPSADPSDPSADPSVPSGAPPASPRSGEDSDDEPERLPPALDELRSATADFRPGAAAHPVAEAFGVRRFITVRPSAEPGVNSESKARILLSSLHMALREAAWDIPMFVQVHRLAMQYFMGTCVGEGVLVEFYTILLKRAPPHLYYLSGLLDLFKQKLSARAVPAVSVSLRLQYTVDDFGGLTYCGEAADPAELEAVLPDLDGETALPLDAAEGLEPLAGLDLMACWHQVAETLLVEDSYSQLNPRHAPLWRVRARPAARAVGLLGLCLKDVWMFCHRRDTFEDLVGRAIIDTPPQGQAPDVTAALSRLTGPGGRAGAVPGRSTHHQAGHRHLDDTTEYVNRLCEQLFNQEEVAPPPPAVPASLPRSVKTQLTEVKSSRPGDLLWRLARVVCLLARSRSSSLLCRVWERFLQQLRGHWETVQPVPGVEEGSPSYNTSLLHQKLQMLNCCIQKRAQGMKSSQDALDSGEAKAEDETEDDDEFFDAPDEGPSEEADCARQQRLPWNQPEGRLKPCGSLRLLETGERLYIPVTQDVAPMTEDRLQEQSEVLVSLGTDSEGCQLRARMMAASLTSDMEAFKAANPGSTLGDFVRWYSPRDWIQEESDDSGKSGSLSARMQIADNLWLEAWSGSKPVPARRQRRLFDETREAERLFHQLVTLRPAQLVQMLSPMIYHAAIYRLVEELEPADLPAIGQQLEEAVRRLHSAAKADWDDKSYDGVGQLIATCEHYVLRRRSLALKLDGVPEKDKFVQLLIGGVEVPVPGGPNGDAARRLERLLTGDQADQRLPPPASKEYILRVPCRRPGAASRPLPQRLHCRVSEDTFRLSASLSQDSVFS
ncbi:rab3 GTPase-activating protein catalytic subunit-like isoform X2 [Amphibalanus amphitrite]|uniref:rab3 GTPase-activating protein catalytic subunit-like isoform X2 n=1 Tax=Amphibalanus amphitrite TaxID=1232801 RepID=UPI001C919828|nr:rab3 GTPase-activating protein catalytic subunit-like isoform X2 [Amphibalanus amphitrite]